VTTYIGQGDVNVSMNGAMVSRRNTLEQCSHMAELYNGRNSATVNDGKQRETHRLVYINDRCRRMTQSIEKDQEAF